MSVSETYLVTFAAASAADFLLAMWLAITIALNALVFFYLERIEQTVNNCLQALYVLFSIFIIGRWGIIVSKVTELLESLHKSGETLPPGSLSMLFGLVGVMFMVSFSIATILYLRSGRKRTRII